LQNYQGSKIVAKMIKANCKWQLVAHSCKCLGCILGDFFQSLHQNTQIYFRKPFFLFSWMENPYFICINNVFYYVKEVLSSSFLFLPLFWPRYLSSYGLFSNFFLDFFHNIFGYGCILLFRFMTNWILIDLQSNWKIMSKRSCIHKLPKKCDLNLWPPKQQW